MLSLVRVLFGVQPKATREMPRIPAPWQDIGFSAVAVEAQDLAPDVLFVPLSDGQNNGYDLLSMAISKGARGALVRSEEVAQRQASLSQLQRPWALLSPTDGEALASLDPHTFLLISVDDPLMALHRLAAYHRRQFTLTVVGITGSVGKTSTKEVVAAVLSRRFRTLKSKHNYNSEATLPTAVLQLTADHDVAVLDMRMWAPGEIRYLASLARPQIGIVTNIGPRHLEHMGSLDAIENAKAELPESLPPDGVAILNADDERVARMAERTQARVFRYGLDPSADLWADAIESRGLEGISFRAHHGDDAVYIKAPLLGRHSVHTVLAGIATGLVLGLGWDEIVAGLQHEDAQLRVFVVQGVGGATIIDDTYEAVPSSALAALNLLAELDGRRIVVMGDMIGLGAVEEEAHRMVGRRAAEVAQELVCVGPRARWIASEAVASGMPAEHILVLEHNNDVIDALVSLLRPGDYVLVKGSYGVAMEQIVAALQRRPEEEV